MSKKHRLITLFVCIIVFLIIAPYLIFYSLGYRIDFANRRVVATGGIYVRALPSGANVIIDSKIDNKTGILSNSVFVQNLLPKEHNILIKKDGYFDYQKNLDVKENEVTKLENVILIKRDIAFRSLGNNIDYYSVSPDQNKLLSVKIGIKAINFEISDLISQRKQVFSLPLANGEITSIKWSDNANKSLVNIKGSYFLLDFSLENPRTTKIPLLDQAEDVSFNPQNTDEIFFIKNNNLYSSIKTSTLLNNVAAFFIENQSITWLSGDGFLYNSDISNITKNKITSGAFLVEKSNAYKIEIIAGKIFLMENESLFLLDQKSQSFEDFSKPVKGLKISPDGQKILYFGDHEISISFINTEKPDKVFINRFSEKIGDCYWLNNEYIVFSLENSIVISETDNRDTINSVNISKILLDNQSNIDIKNPKIFLSERDKILYILNQSNLILSERLIP